MNSLTRWNPLRDMQSLQERLNDLLDWRLGRREQGQSSDWFGWSPSVDIAEDDKEYCIRAELPGLKKEDVNVSFENGQLTISGERKQEQEQKGRRFHRVECSYGRFNRSFTLPVDTKPDQIKAEFKDGVLSVRVPKAESVKPKQITVN